MTTAALIDELNQLDISSSEDYAQLDRYAQLMDLLAQNPEGYQACPRVHTPETCRGHYEPLLLASLERPPTATIWLLNRLPNGAEDSKNTCLLAS
jgi:hypothetical protein